MTNQNNNLVRAGIEKSLSENIELEGGTTFPLEEVEELRLLLQSLMRKEVLESLWKLNKFLNETPVHSEIFSSLVRWSQWGGECKYAQKALSKFKKNRLEKLITLLEQTLESLKELRDTSSQ